jgi:hypothetical protein
MKTILLISLTLVLCACKPGESPQGTSGVESSSLSPLALDAPEQESDPYLHDDNAGHPIPSIESIRWVSSGYSIGLARNFREAPYTGAISKLYANGLGEQYTCVCRFDMDGDIDNGTVTIDRCYLLAYDRSFSCDQLSGTFAYQKRYPDLFVTGPNMQTEQFTDWQVLTAQ